MISQPMQSPPPAGYPQAPIQQYQVPPQPQTTYAGFWIRFIARFVDGLILGISDYVAMRRAMILAIGAYVPVAALVLAFHGLGLPGIWIALGLWLAARSALLGRRWHDEFSETSQECCVSGAGGRGARRRG